VWARICRLTASGGPADQRPFAHLHLSRGHTISGTYQYQELGPLCEARIRKMETAW
jgi:hypothetical protein